MPTTVANDAALAAQAKAEAAHWVEQLKQTDTYKALSPEHQAIAVAGTAQQAEKRFYERQGVATDDEARPTGDGGASAAQARDRNYLYGGDEDAADQDIGYYRHIATAARQRDPVQADYENADLARELGMQSRGDQSGAIGLYRDAAMGKGPSAAQAQFAQALAQSQRAQMSGAASARGGALARAAAQRTAQNNAADMTLNASAASAALRAQEMQAAMQGYAGYSGQQRGQDLSLQGQDAQQAAAQAGLELQSRDQAERAALGYEGLAQGTRGMAMQGASQMEESRWQHEHTSQQETQASMDRADARREARDARTMDYAGRATSAVATYGASEAARAGTSAYAAASDKPKLSDRNAKTDIHDGSAKVQSFLDALNASDYRYKNTGRDGGERHTSVMAQELEKSELGKRMVDDSPEGKRVDYGEGFATMLAAQAQLNDRLLDLESALKAKHGKGGR